MDVFINEIKLSIVFIDFDVHIVLYDYPVSLKEHCCPYPIDIGAINAFRSIASAGFCNLESALSLRLLIGASAAHGNFS